GARPALRRSGRPGGWPTIEASAPRPQRRTAPLWCQDGLCPTSVFILGLTAMYAIVKTGGKQYRVEQGQTLLVERLPAAEGDSVTLDPLLYVDDSQVLDQVDG